MTHRRPNPDVEALLAQADEEARLSELLGGDLTPPEPIPTYRTSGYLPLEEWLRRSEEVHRFLEETRRAEYRARAR